MTPKIILAIDAMGGDDGPEPLIEGALRALDGGLSAKFLLFGDAELLSPLVEARPRLAGACEIRHSEDVVSMTDKPSQAVRRGRKTSMWGAIQAVKNQEAAAVVSSGNTGALMAMSVVSLRLIEGVDRPAIAAIWPTMKGRSVVLDVGANVEADAGQLTKFAIMGEAFCRTLTGNAKPSVGLLNVGAEELKGHEMIRTAAQYLREADPDMNFHGFVEGDDISSGTVDVVVTDGFTGNIALKTAEGAARLVGSWVRGALTGSLLAKCGALLAYGPLRGLKQKMDPNSVNGGVFLGLKGVIVKSHGGAAAHGVASAIRMAHGLAQSSYQAEIAATVARVAQRLSDRPVDESPAVTPSESALT